MAGGEFEASAALRVGVGARSSSARTASSTSTRSATRSAPTRASPPASHRHLASARSRSRSASARSIEVAGPDFHGRATFEVGPVELTVEFGDPHAARATCRSPWDALRPQVPRRGVAPASRACSPPCPARGARPAPVPKRRPRRHRRRLRREAVRGLAEFELTVTTTVPATVTAAASTRPACRRLPEPRARSALRRWAHRRRLRAHAAIDSARGLDHIRGLEPRLHRSARSRWASGDRRRTNDDRKVPKGRDHRGARRRAPRRKAALVGGSPRDAVQPGRDRAAQAAALRRQPAARAASSAGRSTSRGRAASRSTSVAATYTAAKPWPRRRHQPTALAALRGDGRAAPARQLGEGLDADADGRSAADIEPRRPGHATTVDPRGGRRRHRRARGAASRRRRAPATTVTGERRCRASCRRRRCDAVHASLPGGASGPAPTGCRGRGPPRRTKGTVVATGRCR